MKPFIKKREKYFQTLRNKAVNIFETLKNQSTNWQGIAKIMSSSTPIKFYDHPLPRKQIIWHLNTIRMFQWNSRRVRECAQLMALCHGLPPLGKPKMSVWLDHLLGRSRCVLRLHKMSEKWKYWLWRRRIVEMFAKNFQHWRINQSFVENFFI